MTTYKNPPVTEVVAEFFFQPSNWDLAVPGMMFEKIKDDFPIRRMPPGPALVVPTPANLSFAGQQMLVPNPFPRVDRVYFVRKDEKVLVQLAPNMLVVNNVKMWTDWEDFFPVLKSIFDKYTSVVENWKIARLGLQYVNQLRLPAGTDGITKLEDYLQFYPHTAGNLPDHGPFAMTVHFPADPKDPTQDWIETQLGGLEFDQKGNTLGVKLEIKSYTPSARNFDTDGIYSWMEQAHRNVVTMFEGCITEKSREIFRRDRGAE